jgi:hypothetical protein
LRKYLIVAIAALTALAFTTVALAQSGPEATMQVKIAPKKAGTKKKPKNSSIDLTITNNNNKRTLSQLTITAPKTFKLNAKGLTKCASVVLENQGPSACPKASKVGGGTAEALLGVNGPSPTPLHFDVTAVVTGAKSIGFHLHSDQPDLNIVSPGRLSGRKLIIGVPAVAQEPLPGTFAGLVSIHTTLKGKKGKHYLASTVGCKKKKHAFSTKLTFINNGVTPAGNVVTKASSKCSGK